MSYENETCEGCKLFFITGDVDEDVCMKNGNMAAPDGRCDQFTPSLLCRKVRALEKLATCVGHHIGADHPVIAVAEQTRLHENA
jgi:hypothetical protein